RRTRRIHRDRRTLHPQPTRHSPQSHTRRQPRQPVALHPHPTTPPLPLPPRPPTPPHPPPPPPRQTPPPPTPTPPSHRPHPPPHGNRPAIPPTAVGSATPTRDSTAAAAATGPISSWPRRAANSSGVG